MKQPTSVEESTYQSFEDLQRPLLLPPETDSTQNNENVVDDDDDDDDDRNVDHVYSQSATAKHWYQNPIQITAMISNLSTSYNVVNISLVLPILKELHPDITDKDTAAIASSLLAGMIFGQIFGGALGDSRLGRLGALRLVMTLQIVASLASASLGTLSDATTSSHPTEDIFLWLSFFRFLLGVGCGGVYPLAAVLSAEEGTGDEEDNQQQMELIHVPIHAVDSDSSLETNNLNFTSNHVGKIDDLSPIHRVVLTFSTQGLGFVSVPLIAVLLLNCTSDLNIVWRALLGLGAIPGFILMAMQCWKIITSVGQSEEESDRELENNSILASTTTNFDERERITILDRRENVQIANETISDDNGSGENENAGWIQTLVNEPGLGQKVLGTAGTWFLFDIVFYGNTIFQPIVVEEAFGNKNGSSGIELLRTTATNSLILTTIALPGYAFAGIIMGKKCLCATQTPRYVMLQGFAAMTILYATIGLNWTYLRGDPTMLVFLYGMTFFFANYGPNTITFILPSLIFDEEHRSTWNGVSAAAGKLGALTGATLFEPAADTLGDHVVMLICAGVALLGYLLTYYTIPKQEKVSDRPSMVDTTADIAFRNEIVMNP